jgi:hypothetical protein
MERVGSVWVHLCLSDLIAVVLMSGAFCLLDGKPEREAIQCSARRAAQAADDCREQVGQRRQGADVYI